MCGIVGYLGTNEAAPILVEALRRLEYRGYDSAGIATLHDGGIQCRKEVGRLDRLSNLLVRDPIRGMTGIGHTRWATHGCPTTENAHPHSARDVSVVHNGIIENWSEIREELEADGYGFSSETDTEVIPVLCQRYIDRGMEPVEAFNTTVDRLEGQYAICAIFAGFSDLVCAASRGSPLAVGHGDTTRYIASDALGLAGLTDRITYLKDGDRAVVTSTGLSILNDRGMTVKREITKVLIDRSGYGRQGFKHYMQKEIFEQPARLAGSMEFIMDDAPGHELNSAVRCIASANHVRLVGCGTAYYAGLVGSYWLEELTGIPAGAEMASEFRYRNVQVSKDSTTVFISQSGETADTLAAMEHVQKEGGRDISLLNSMTSTMARKSGHAVPINAGLEIGVASTKAYSCQLAMLFGISVLAATERNTLSTAERDAHLDDLARLPGMLNTVLDLNDQISAAAQDISGYANLLFIGRNSMYPTALEGALKLKEISYIHAEGLAAGELKHGPIALIEKTFPTIVLAPSNSLFRKTISNMEEVLARNGPVILVTDHKGADKASHAAMHTIVLPEINPLLAPLLYVVPLQLLAYHTAVIKGTDVDMPRNLAKSVTVE